MAARRILPGFRLSVSWTVLYLAAMVLIPLAACLLKASSLTFQQFLAAVGNERALAAYWVTFKTSLVAAVVDTFLGLLLAWVLVRYQFPLKSVFDALVDLPFALPTAVAGLVYSNLYARNGWIGKLLLPWGIDITYSETAIVLVLTFIGLPFVVRTVQPVLESLDAEVEDAAACLGASRWLTFRRVILPPLYPALLTGFALTFARALGEYGSVIFVSGNKQYFTEIAPVLIVYRLEEFAYAEATAIAVVLLTASFAMLAAINLLERRVSRYGA